MSLAYFPLFPADFDADTGHLSFAEDGAYNRLLRLSWRCHEAKMPNDLDWICRKARAVTEEDRALIAGILAEFFTTKGGKIFSKKLHEIWIEANTAHAKRVLAGISGGKAKARKTREKTASNTKAMPEQCASNQNQNHKEEDSEANASDGEAVAEDFAKQVFDRAVAFLGRHGTKPAQARSFVGKLRKDHPDTAIFDAFAACGKAGAVDPIPWITARLRKPKTDLDAAFAQFLGNPQ